jgi:hypothetical protein
MKKGGITRYLITILLLGISLFISSSAFAIAPTVSSVTIDYNDGASPALVVTWSVDVAGTNDGSVDQTKFHVRNATGVGPDIINLPVETVDGTQVKFNFTEAQRLLVQAKSGAAAPVGDGVAVVLDIDAGAVQANIGLEPNLASNNNAATETADTTRPTVDSATSNYNDTTRQLVVTFSETVAASATDQTLFHINNITGTDVVTLTDATASPDGTTLTFTLTEAQRVAALAISGVAGGDGGAVVLDVDAGGATDMAGNTTLLDDNNAVAETADTNKPSVSSWSLDLSVPTITLNFSETADVSTRDLTAITIQDAATATNSHTLTTSDTASGDGTSIVINLSLADKAGISAFAVDLATSWLRTTALLIDDMAANSNTTIVDGSAKQATAHTGTIAASASKTTVIASPTGVYVDNSVIITVTPKDASGANLGAGEPVSLGTTLGSLVGSVSDAGNGTYTQSLTSSVAGRATVTAAVRGVVIDQKPAVEFYALPYVPTPVNPDKTTASAAPTEIPADGIATSLVTVIPRDDNYVRLDDGESVSLSTTNGTLLGSVSYDSGKYTQLLQSPVTPGTAAITAKVNGVVISQVPVVTFKSGTVVSSTTTTAGPNSSTTTTVKTTSSTSTVSSSSTTTSARSLWPMSYDKMWDVRKDENLLLLRVFRDEMLLNTEVGREYVYMLYDNSLEIALLLLKEPSLTTQTKEVIDKLLLGVESLLYNDEIAIRQETIDNLVSLLDGFESKASPKLRAAIRKAKRGIQRGEIFEQLVITIGE